MPVYAAWSADRADVLMDTSGNVPCPDADPLTVMTPGLTDPGAHLR